MNQKPYITITLLLLALLYSPQVISAEATKDKKAKSVEKQATEKDKKTKTKKSKKAKKKKSKSKSKSKDKDKSKKKTKKTKKTSSKAKTPKKVSTPSAKAVASSTGFSMTTKVVAGVVAAGGAAAMAGGGGGGGGGGAPTRQTTTLIHPENHDPSSFATAEANRTEAIRNSQAGMNAYAAYARGYDGRIWNRDSSTGYLLDTNADGFVKVAVIDTGVDLDHFDLDDNIIAGSGAYCRFLGACDTGGNHGDFLSLSNNGWHGTAVAGIIAGEKNDFSISAHGVAYNSKIIPIKFDFSTTAEFKAINHAINQGAKVINASYGLSAPIVNANEFDPSTGATTATANSASSVRSLLTSSQGGQSLLQAYQRLVTTNTILVYSSGNDYYSQPSQNSGLTYFFQGNMDGDINKPSGYDIINPEKYDFTNNIVTAIALNSDRTIADFSNRCGVAKNWCLATAGVDEYSTYPNGSIVSGINGTSFSAPGISGAIAIMAGAFPHLSASKIMTILYDTAIDLGDAGIDEIYGRGLVDLDAATSPSIGGWNIATSSTQSQLSNFNNSYISLPTTFGQALTNSTQEIMFLDKYNKNYYVPLKSFARDDATRYKKSDYLFAKKYDSTTNHTSKISDNISFNFSKTATSNIDNNKSADATSFNTTFHISENEQINLGLALNQRTENIENDNNKFLTSNLGFSPISTSESNFNSVNFTYNKNEIFSNLTISRSTFSKDGKEYSTSHKSDDTSLFTYSVGTKSSTGNTLSLHSGLMLEKDSLLGAKSSGAFNLGNNNKTYYIGAAGEYNISNFSLFGEASFSFSNNKNARNSLVTSAKNITANSFKLGIKSENWGMMLSQPFAISSGSLNLKTPTSIDSNNNVRFSNNKVSLASKHRETDLEIFYNFSPNINKDDSLEFNTIYRNNPNGIDINSEIIGFATYKMKF